MKKLNCFCNHCETLQVCTMSAELDNVYQPSCSCCSYGSGAKFTITITCDVCENEIYEEQFDK